MAGGARSSSRSYAIHHNRTAPIAFHGESREFSYIYLHTRAGSARGRGVVAPIRGGSGREGDEGLESPKPLVARLDEPPVAARIIPFGDIRFRLSNETRSFETLLRVS